MLCSPPDDVEAQALMALLTQRGIACRLEPRGVALYPTVLGRGDVIRVRREDLARAQVLLDRWHAAGRAARSADREGGAMQLDALALDARPLEDEGDARLARQRELYRRFGPMGWEQGLPWALVAAGLLGAMEELWSGVAASRPTALLLWIGCAVVGSVLALPSTGLRDAPLRRSLAALWALDGAARAGDCERIGQLSARLLETLPDGACPFLFVNALVNHLVTCGRYREALAITDRWSAEARQRGAELDAEQAWMTELNQIEALYCMGRLGEAQARLDALPRDGGSPLLTAGLGMQEGWLAVLKGDGERALAALATVVETDVPHEYRAELWLARARALAAVERQGEAREAAETGLSLAVRAPSERNALFVLADVARAAGALDEAAELYAEGAEHPYQGQGGEALLAWGDVEHTLGREERARAAWTAATRRDPESAAAELAKQRLAT